MTNLWSHANWHLMESTVARVYWLPHNSMICKTSKLVTGNAENNLFFRGKNSQTNKRLKKSEGGIDCQTKNLAEIVFRASRSFTVGAVCCWTHLVMELLANLFFPWVFNTFLLLLPKPDRWHGLLCQRYAIASELSLFFITCNYTSAAKIAAQCLDESSLWRRKKQLSEVKPRKTDCILEAFFGRSW